MNGLSKTHNIDYIKEHLERNKCISCGEDRSACLVLHQRDTSWSKLGKKDIDEELAKCDVMCANCRAQLEVTL